MSTEAAKKTTEAAIAEQLRKHGLVHNDDGTVSGSLVKGLTIAGQLHKTFTLRESTAGDLFAAESAVNTEKALTYRTAVLCQQLVKLGSFEGPFTVRLLSPMSKNDISRLHDAQDVVDVLGEVAPRG